MPIYEYSCTNCGADIEALLKVGAPNPACPECGEDTLKRRVSMFDHQDASQALSAFDNSHTFRRNGSYNWLTKDTRERGRNPQKPKAKKDKGNPFAGIKMPD